jgi:hypothetical protein
MSPIDYLASQDRYLLIMLIEKLKQIKVIRFLIRAAVTLHSLLSNVSERKVFSDILLVFA